MGIIKKGINRNQNDSSAMTHLDDSKTQCLINFDRGNSEKTEVKLVVDPKVCGCG